MRRSLLLLSLFLLAAPVAAQDARQVYDRLDRIERDMNLLQRQVYRGGGAPVPAPSGDGTAALNAEIRIDQLETQLRALTGQVEEMNYGLEQVRRRMDRLVGDVDQRFGALEKGDAPAGGAAPAPAAGAATAGRPGAPPPATAGSLGTLPASRPGGATVPPPPAVASLPSGAAQDQYNYAFGLLRRGDYPAAEAALRAFVQAHPNDPLAGNAQYWLGETYYVRNDFNNAAIAFAEGYRRYPRSAKGADTLLKLGMSLGGIGQKTQACGSLNQIARDYPDAAGSTKERAAQEKQKLGC